MGCSGTKVKEDPTMKLERLKAKVMTTISNNDIKISKLEKDISNMEAQIKQGEADLKQNQYSYSETEKINKAKRLIDLKKDQQRNQKSLDSLRTYNETLKNNLDMLKKKIEEIRNNKQIQEGNELMNELKDLDNGETLQANLNNLMIERQKEEENMQIMKNGNNAINNDLGINEDEYLKRILGS